MGHHASPTSPLLAGYLTRRGRHPPHRVHNTAHGAFGRLFCCRLDLTHFTIANLGAAQALRTRSSVQAANIRRLSPTCKSVKEPAIRPLASAVQGMASCRAWCAAAVSLTSISAVDVSRCFAALFPTVTLGLGSPQTHQPQAQAARDAWSAGLTAIRNNLCAVLEEVVPPSRSPELEVAPLLTQ